MAKRPDFSPDLPLSPEQLESLRQRLARLSTSSVQQTYAEAWERCKLARDGKPPRAEHIQELVQIWKQLRRSPRS